MAVKEVVVISKADASILKQIVRWFQRSGPSKTPQRRRGGLTGFSHRLATEVISDNPEFMDGVWFRVTDVDDPLTGIEQSIVDGAYSDKTGASEVTVQLYPQIDETHYAVGNKIYCVWMGTEWVSTYNQPAAFCED